MEEIKLATTSEDGAITGMTAFSDLDRTFEAIKTLIEMRFVTDECPAIIEYKDYEVEIRPGDNYQETEDDTDDGVWVEEGDTVIDKNPPAWSDEERLVVENVTEIPAYDYPIAGPGDNTVADDNPQYPDLSPVIEAHPVGATGTYAYPLARLEPDKPSGSTMTSAFE